MAIAKLPKGLLTQTKLLTIAKQLFFEKGYSETSIKEICEIAQEKTGTFAYYFKTKEKIVSQIYADLLMNCYSFVSKKENRKMDSLEKNTIVALIYYLVIFESKNTIAFHYETMQRESIESYMGPHLTTRFHKQFVYDLKLDLDESELDDILLAEYGLRREIVTKFIENPGNKTINDVVNKIHLFRARLMKIDENLMRAYLFNANEFIHKYDYSPIRFLI